MNVRLHLLLLLTFCVVSCRSQAQEIGSIRYDCIEIPTLTPDDLLEWPAAVFVFRHGQCASLKEVEALGNLRKIDDAQKGDSIVCVASKSLPVIDFSRFVSGGADGEYFLTYVEDSEILSACSIVEKPGSLLSQMLTPITARVSVELVNAPASAKASIVLPEMSDTWFISRNQYKVSKECAGRKVRSGEKVTVFPQADGASGWFPNIEICCGSDKLRPFVPKVRRIEAGQSIVFTVDMKNLSTNNTYKISWKTTETYGGKAIEEREYEFVAEHESEGFYSVSMFDDGEWVPLQVYKTLCSDAAKHSLIWNDWENAKVARDTMSYCIFENDFNAPVRLRVENLRGNVSSVEVRPSEYGIETKSVSSNTIEFTITSYEMRKLSVEFGGDRQHNLFIYGAKPDKDKPSSSSANVKYYGPGTYNAGTINLSSGQTLYIDYGAKVYANVKAKGDNITIAGNGILSGEMMKHWGDSQYSWGDFLVECEGSKGLNIKNVTFIDSPGWNMIVRCIDEVKIENINMISWELNGDGIDIVSCKDVEISGCFIRTYDDCITLKCRFIVTPITDVSNVRIHDCLIWNDYARGIVIGPEAGNVNYSGRIHNIKVYDCTFLQHKNSGTDDLRAAFAIGQGTDGSTSLWNGSIAPTEISDITVSNLTFDNIDNTGRNISIWQYGGEQKVNMNRVTFNGIKVLNKNGNQYPAFNVMTHGSYIGGLTIKDFTVNGKVVTDVGSQFEIDNPSNVEARFQ